MLPYARKDALRSPVHTVSTQENFIDVPERVDILGRVAVYDVSRAVLHLEVVDPGNVGMVQAGGQPSLPLEGLQVLGVVSDRLVDDLYGNDTVQRGIPGTVDRALAASGYPLK